MNLVVSKTFLCFPTLEWQHHMSVISVFVILGTCIALQLGSNPGLLFFECFSAVTLFYIAHWQTYVSGTLRFGK